MLRVAAAALAAVFVGPAGIAMAETPTTAASSGNSTVTNGATPLFTGPAGVSPLVSPLLSICLEGPSIEVQPTDQTVIEPGGASFTVTEGAPPSECSPATIQWQVSTDGVTWNNVSAGNASGGTSSTLSIGPTSTSESGDEYRAILTNETLVPAISHEVTLIVEPEPEPCSAKPAITGEPGNETVVAPEAATFNASASRPANCALPTIEWQVSTDGVHWSNVSSSQTLSINPTNVSESENEYRAVFTNEAGSTDSNPATLTVEPEPCSAKPAITGEPGNETVVAPEAATFNASASRPANCALPTIEWQVSTDGVHWSNVSSSQTLSINPTNVSESENEYRAVFTNEAGSTDSNPATLTVEPEPCSAKPAITGEPGNETVVAPEAATFNASASRPANCALPTIEWQVSTDGVHWSNVSSSQTLSINPTNVSESENEYRAVFTNEAGSTDSNTPRR